MKAKSGLGRKRGSETKEKHPLVSQNILLKRRGQDRVALARGGTFTVVGIVYFCGDRDDANGDTGTLCSST